MRREPGTSARSVRLPAGPCGVAPTAFRLSLLLPNVTEHSKERPRLLPPSPFRTGFKAWPTSDFHVSVSRTVLHMLALSRLKGKPGYCPSFLPWVFSKGAETAPFSSTCNSAGGMLHQEMGAGGRMPPPSLRETILSLSWYSTSERVWQDRAPLPAAITSSVTPAVGSPSFLVSCSLTPASCTSFHQQHPNPHLSLCFGGIQTETELHLL